jgi:phosphoribosylaminoimidazole-succinocarboxamide synthase
MTTSTVTQTDLEGLRLLNRGKVRDIYDLDDKLLIVTTDRISAFDHVLPTAIPDKGAVLTDMSERWFGLTEDIVPNHLITTDVDAMGDDVRRHAEVLRGRTMLVKRAERIDAECVVRAYLTGSALVDYNATGTIFGVAMPSGLLDGSKLPELMFTPTTKAEVGHDEPVTIEELGGMVGVELAARLQELSSARAMKWLGTMWPVCSNQNFDMRERTRPLSGMPFGSTTSNAEMRSVATISSRPSPRSNVSRTLPR